MTPKICEACGANRTVKGNELTGRFCSPVCRDRSIQRRFKDVVHNWDAHDEEFRAEAEPNLDSSGLAALFDSIPIEGENDGTEN